MQLDQEFKDSDADESIDFDQITPEKVFKTFTVNAASQVIVKTEPVEERKESGKPIEIQQDADSDDEDSDNDVDDGDFKVKYKSPSDDFSDLSSL